MNSFLDPALLFFAFGAILAANMLRPRAAASPAVLAQGNGAVLQIGTQPGSTRPAPPLHAALALALAAAAGLSVGSGALLAVLAASASHIAVPAVLRHALPEANPSLYFGRSLGVAFPFNIPLGIPRFVTAARQVLG